MDDGRGHYKNGEKEKYNIKIVPAVFNPPRDERENSPLLMGNSSHLVVCWPPTDGAILYRDIYYVSLRLHCTATTQLKGKSI